LKEKIIIWTQSGRLVDTIHLNVCMLTLLKSLETHWSAFIVCVCLSTPQRG